MKTGGASGGGVGYKLKVECLEGGNEFSEGVLERVGGEMDQERVRSGYNWRKISIWCSTVLEYN